jgi:hypothetical protein
VVILWAYKDPPTFSATTSSERRSSGFISGAQFALTGISLAWMLRLLRDAFT